MLPDPRSTSTFPEFTVNCAVIGVGAWAFGPLMSRPSQVIGFDVCAPAPNAIITAKAALTNFSPVAFDLVFTKELAMRIVRIWQRQRDATWLTGQRAYG